MRFRLGALLCLSGIVACSHQSTAGDPAYPEESTVASTDPPMVPASLENQEPAPRRSNEEVATPAPTIVPNNDTRSDEIRSNGSTSPANPPQAVVPAPAPRDVPPDNTKVNKRDNSAAALTPMDQNNNQRDLDITQKIRQSVMADGSLSFTAKNVKIITQNGKVTLRGPVNTQEERSAIEAAARKVAGSGQVDNQLEVKP
jgi:hyperosmotically inducible periplasmic protein